MSVARRASSTARRSLLTATAAGTLLGALWFVPSANATQDAADIRQQTSTTANTTDADGTDATDADGTSTTADSDGRDTELADTGSPNTTPYIIGGTMFLALGAGFVAYSVRQGRLEAY
ncbi:hypothetical protein [Streptomyces ipomoeae]|uniref:hypothetical protein n=1 Tax=Streptomyces ipomoeae TaxID=103232 RepID=UPI0015F0394B|nr:hypothetical protein [Streptomyces ipomoeae]MDX2931200.1 hypothetical protein [Streptomyces ipomoeae]